MVIFFKKERTSFFPVSFGEVHRAVWRLTEKTKTSWVRGTSEKQSQFWWYIYIFLFFFYKWHKGHKAWVKGSVLVLCWLFFLDNGNTCWSQSVPLQNNTVMSSGTKLRSTWGWAVGLQRPQAHQRGTILHHFLVGWWELSPAASRLLWVSFPPSI